MPQQDWRLGFPCTTGTWVKGKLITKHRTAWLNVVITKRGRRYCYIKQSVVGYGDLVTKINITVMDAMLQFLVDKTGKGFTRLSIKQKEILYGKSRKETIKKTLNE